MGTQNFCVQTSLVTSDQKACYCTSSLLYMTCAYIILVSLTSWPSTSGPLSLHSIIKKHQCQLLQHHITDFKKERERERESKNKSNRPRIRDKGAEKSPPIQASGHQCIESANSLLENKLSTIVYHETIGHASFSASFFFFLLGEEVMASCDDFANVWLSTPHPKSRNVDVHFLSLMGFFSNRLHNTIPRQLNSWCLKRTAEDCESSSAFSCRVY